MIKKLKNRWIRQVVWTKENPVIAIMLYGAAVLVILQIVRVYGQYQELLTIVDSLHLR